MTISRRMLIQGASLTALAGLGPLAAVAAQAEETAPVDWPEMLKAGTLPEISMGDAGAPVTIIEYHSMTCPHCAHFHSDILPTLDEKYIKPGKVRLILRAFPLNQLDAVAFMLLRCRPTDTYLDNVKLFYEKQKDWAYSDKPKEAITSLSEQIGFTQESFDACLKDQTVWNGLVEVAKKADETFKVDGTPEFFINGTRQGTIASVEDLESKLAAFIKN
ncbi:MAG: thioredoxin domain-containing protein [Ancalomicrobiaceae bacterium]|nr:thioredoxin domain-containing protein [Ancalomicrobiaceae bacterium]